MDRRTFFSFGMSVFWLALACNAIAEPLHFRFSGDLIKADISSMGCDALLLPARFEICFTVQSDAVDNSPEISWYAGYTIDEAVVELGDDCRFSIDESSPPHYRTLRIWDEYPNLLRDIIEVQLYIQSPNGERFDTGLYLGDPSPSNLVVTDAVPTAAPDLGLASVAQIWDVSLGRFKGYPDSSVLDSTPCVGAEVLLTELAADVIALNLETGISNSLDAKLSAVFDALTDLNENNDSAVANQLYAFINAVEAQRGNKISNADADYLVTAAIEILDSL